MRGIELVFAIATVFCAVKWFGAELAGRAACEILRRHGINPSEEEVKAVLRAEFEEMFRLRK